MVRSWYSCKSPPKQMLFSFMTRKGKVPKLNFHPSRSRPWLNRGGVSVQASHPAPGAPVQYQDWVHPPAPGPGWKPDLSWRGAQAQVRRHYRASSLRQAEAQDTARQPVLRLFIYTGENQLYGINRNTCSKYQSGQLPAPSSQPLPFLENSPSHRAGP